MGKDALPRYYEQCLSGKKPVFHAIEKDYRARLIDPKDPTGKGISIKGKIDRIDVQSSVSAIATVIDYKTGAAKTEKVIRGGLEPGVVSRTEEGANFRQLVFYALLHGPVQGPGRVAGFFVG